MLKYVNLRVSVLEVPGILLKLPVLHLRLNPSLGWHQKGGGHRHSLEISPR